ncbi:hypothetical protein EZV62_001393 [Acer yangbiense]|uniref:BHLH domain-containing protein n=1 Tax=Acer yangbiense TaxID=1000413 RepID=A0A5C7IVC7_9ROSI|nr:hypothetical protein EZV62_001393 [Acer yangbiense]
MYNPSSSSSSMSSPSSQKPLGPATSGGLTRYVSAPGSLLTTAVDSVIGSHPSLVGHYFSPSAVGGCGGGAETSSSSFTSESTCKVNSSNDPNNIETKSGVLKRSYGFNEMAHGSSLLRQRSSPAGFFSHPTTDNGGFSVTRESGHYNSQGSSNSGVGVSRLKSQLSFTRQDSLSQISQVSENGIDRGNSGNGHHQNPTHSYATTSFGIDSSWENGNSIVFSAPPNKRNKTMDGDIFNCLGSLESQFSLPQTSLEMATVEKLLQIPEDSVPCKIRAKRGCATHPRSIAERERRTRISGKLKKLQDLVPNMDKQTSYADMLDLAVQHIKGLQNHVQVCNMPLGKISSTKNLRIAHVDVNKPHDICYMGNHERRYFVEARNLQKVVKSQARLIL